MDLENMKLEVPANVLSIDPKGEWSVMIGRQQVLKAKEANTDTFNYPLLIKELYNVIMGITKEFFRISLIK